MGTVLRFLSASILGSLTANRKNVKRSQSVLFYPAGANITDYYKEHLGLDYCTWIPYTGSLDDPEAFMASEELQAAVGADGFSDGLSEA